MKQIAILTGMTAAGKSEVALEFAAARGDIELINADSVQVFRRMDIGSAKPSAEEQARVRHHLLDIRNPDEPFSAGGFRRAVDECLTDIECRGKRALIVGGTGFYLKALLYGMWQAEEADPTERERFRDSLAETRSEDLLARIAEKDPVTAKRLPASDRYRLVRALEVMHFTGKTPTELEDSMPTEPDPRFTLLVLDRPKEELEQRIEKRTREMLRLGFLEEVQKLLRDFHTSRALQAVGYAQVVAHIEGRLPAGRKSALTEENLVAEISLATRQLCKRQRTWFRSEKNAKMFELEKDRAALLTALAEIY